MQQGQRVCRLPTMGISRVCEDVGCGPKWRVVNVPSAFDYNIATWDLLKIPDWNLYRALATTAADKRLKDVKGLTLVDGSIVEALPRIAMASLPVAQAGSGDKMKWTLLIHFEFDRSISLPSTSTNSILAQRSVRSTIFTTFGSVSRICSSSSAASAI